MLQLTVQPRCLCKHSTTLFLLMVHSHNTQQCCIYTCAPHSIYYTAGQNYHDRLLFHSHRRTVLTAPLYGVSQGVLLLGYIVAFRFGIHQVTLPEDHLLYTSFADMFKIFTALVFVCINIGMSTSLAPDYAKAKVSAKRIFSLLDRKPKPDAYSEHGVKLVSYQTQILKSEFCRSEICLQLFLILK